MSSNRARNNYDRFLAYNKDSGYKIGGKRTVWVADENEGFIRGEVEDVKDKKFSLKFGDGSKKTVPESKTLPANPVKFDGVEDCAELSHLNNATVFQNLKVRYLEDLIHTSSGLFLVVINPYKWIPIYTPEMIEMYRGKRRNEVHPHTFAIADESYRAMIRNHKNQSMLITGESGAGKTENTKKVIQYLAHIAGKADGQLEKQILQANPMLEAFGNAKTNKNDNSSRFGKYIRIQFSDAGTIVGTTIQSYLLEKSRVIFQGRGERNFHIFYQILAGASDAQKKKYHLLTPHDYKIFCDKDSIRCKSMDDREEWGHTVDAMSVIGLSTAEQDAVFRMVSGLMLCGNIKYGSSYGGSGATIENGDVIEKIAELWKIDGATFEKALIRPKVKAGTEIVEKHLSPEEASYSREAMCKSIYERSFLWLVKKLNTVLAADYEANFIGVLDIAGFEIFENNSFEQLCINFTNEKLQQFFNNHMFQKEQEEYANEKIDWKFINFGVDSQAVVDLIESKTGSVLAILDEETIFPRASDKSLASKMHSLEKKSKKYGTIKFKDLHFSICHYAGDVIYDVTGWIDKNKDPLQEDIRKAVAGSGDEFFSDLMTDVDLDPRERMSVRRAQKMKEAGKSASRAGSGATFMTVAQVYKDQLGDLMDTLRATEPSFIRCIIPNLQKKPHFLQADLVLEQLACNGVLEGIRISRLGYPNRVAYKPFVQRYYLLHPTLRRDDPESKEATKTVMEHLKKEVAEHLKDTDTPTPYFQFGLTKVFFRHGVLAFLEEKREAKLSSMVVSVQSAARGWLGRSAYKKVNMQGSAAKTVQRNVSQWLKLKQWTWWQLFVQSKPLLANVGMDTMIKDQEDKIEEYEQAIKDAQEESARLGKDFASKKDKLQDLEIQLNEAKERLASLEKARDAADADNKKLSGDIEDLEKQVKDLEGNNSSKGSDLKSTKADLEQAKESLADEESKIGKLEDAASDNKKRIGELSEQASDLDSAVSKLKKQMAATQEDLEGARDRLTDGDDQGSKLQKQLSGLEADVDQAKDELADEKSAGEKTQSGIKKVKGQTADTQEELDDTRAQLTKVKQLVNTLKSDQEDTEGQLDKAKRNVADLTKKQGGLKNDVANVKSEQEEEENATDAREKKNKDLKSQVDDLEQQVADLEDAVSSLQSKTKQQQSERGDLASKNDSVQAEIAKLTKKLNALKQDLEEAEAKLAEETKRKQEAEAAVKKADSALKDVQGDLDQAKADAERARKETDKLKKQASSVQAEADDLEAAADAQQSKNAKAKAELDERRGALEEAEDKAAEFSRAQKALQLELEDVNARREEAEEERERAAKGASQKAVTDKEAERDKLEADQRDLEAQLRAKEAEAQELASQAAAGQVEEEKALWGAFLDRLMAELEQTRRNMKELEARNKIAEKTLGATRMAALAGDGPEEKEEKKKVDDEYGYSRKPVRKKKEWPAWVLVQQRTFTRWCNSFLVERMIRIDDFEEDFTDGVKLVQLLEIISDKNLGRYKKAPKMRAHKLENVSLALNFIKKEGIRLVGIGPEDVVDPKLKLILGLIWTIILRYQIQQSEGGGSPKAELLKWVNSKIGADTKFGLTIKNFKGDWQDGKAIGSLVESVNPGSFNLPRDFSGNALRDAIMAFDKATEMGIPDLLLPEDMVNATDELSNMTYISYFRSWETQAAARKQIEALRQELDKLNAAWKEHSDMLKELAHVQREIFADRDIIEACELVSGKQVLAGKDQ